MNKREKGITLLALIITIIILIMLAAVTIKLLFDANIIDLAKIGRESHEQQQEKEQNELDKMAIRIHEEINLNKNQDPEEDDKDVEETESELRIYTKAGMEIFRDRVNAGETFKGKTVYLMKDIDLNGNDSDIWVPIGWDWEQLSFEGTFEGNYHTISNLYYKGDSYAYPGLFSANHGTIKNLILENAYVYSYRSSSTEIARVGAIAGMSIGTITNCGVNSGEVIGENMEADSWCSVHVGGITGAAVGGEISSCYNKASIKIICNRSKISQGCAGGIAGNLEANSWNKLDTIMKDCYNIGDVTVTAYGCITGGVAGDAYRESGRYLAINNLYNIGKFENTGSSIIVRTE